MKKIGLALGGGGAKGLAHIPMLEAFDELNVRPQCVTGTSMGAVFGALYASGASGEAIREQMAGLSITERDTIAKLIFNREISKWIDFIDPEFGRRGLFRGERFLDFLAKVIPAETFEDLVIPLKIVTTDFWQRQQVVIDSGPLLPAIRASMSLPFLLTPVVYDGRVLVDGGAVNPVPFDLLDPDCDVTVAIDVMGDKTKPDDDIPSMFEAVFQTLQIMQKTIIEQKLMREKPDLLVRVAIKDIRVLDFYKIDQILQQADKAKRKLKHDLARLLSKR